MPYPLALGSRAVRVLDVVMAVWVLLWVGLAAAIVTEVRELRALSDMVVSSSEVLEETGAAVSALRDLPVVGERIEALQERLRAAGESVRARGEASRATIDLVSAMLGACVALIPTVPFLGLYLPLRTSYAREVRALRRAVERHGDDPSFKQFLARRATQRLAYHQLARLGERPWEDLERGHVDALSAAELRRLGLERRYGRTARAARR